MCTPTSSTSTANIPQHDGLRQDGQPDKRMQQDSFAHGKVDPVEAGKQGGQSGGSAGGQANAGGDDYKPTENDVWFKNSVMCHC